MCRCGCECAYVYKCTCMHLHVYMRRCVHVHMHAHWHVIVHVYVYAYTRELLHAYVYVNVYIFVCMLRTSSFPHARRRTCMYARDDVYENVVHCRKAQPPGMDFLFHMNKHLPVCVYVYPEGPSSRECVLTCVGKQASKE